MHKEERSTGDREVWDLIAQSYLLYTGKFLNKYLAESRCTCLFAANLKRWRFAKYIRFLFCISTKENIL